MSIVLEDSEITKHKFTVGEFYQMGEAGIFGEDSRVELVSGDIIHIAPIGSNHSSVLAFLYHSLIEQYKRKHIVSVQNPLLVDVNTELQPDIQILKFRPDYYRSQHPSPQDALMIIEVADTSFNYDRTVKAELYAIAGIPHYAVVNTIAETVE